MSYQERYHYRWPYQRPLSDPNGFEKYFVPYTRDFQTIKANLAESLIQGPEDIEKLFRLNINHTIDWPNDLYARSNPRSLLNHCIDLFMQTDIRPPASFCDFGFGTGFPLVFFAAIGFQTYGIDIHNRPIQNLDAFIALVEETFGKKLKCRPIVKKYNMLADDIADMAFGDGKQIKDIDVFYLCQNGFSIKPIEIMRNLQSCKQGAVWLGHYFRVRKWQDEDRQDEPLLLTTPFRPIDPEFPCSLLQIPVVTA